YTEPRQMLTSVFGAAMQTEILAKARADLYERVRLLLNEELVRFVAVIDAAAECDDTAAIRLYQAEYSLEAVRAPPKRPRGPGSRVRGCAPGLPRSRS